MTEYILLLCGGKPEESASPEELQHNLNNYYAWVNQLRADGVYVDASKLTADGYILRNKQGQIQVDGPFTETKETIGGYFIISAEDYDGALNIAQGCPIFAENGYLEIREIAQ